MSVHLYTSSQFVDGAMVRDGVGELAFLEFCPEYEILRLNISSWKRASRAHVLALADSGAGHNGLDGVPSDCA